MSAQPARAPAPLRGSLRPPGDKSTSHRALLLAGLAEGTSLLHGVLRAGDTHSTRGVLAALGARVEERDDGALAVTGAPEPASPAEPLDCGNAGTLARLLLGLLAGHTGRWTLDGDESLRRRPMARVTEPLRALGARVRGDRLPLLLQGAALRGGRVRVELPSAQVKSALLLAGLRASAPLTVLQAVPTRDETERLLPRFGARLERAAGEATVHPGPLRATELHVPGDPSSAAFPLLAALLVPGSEVLLRGVDLSPRRTGLLRALERAGAELVITARAPGQAARDPLRPGGTALTRSERDASRGQQGDLLARASTLQPFDLEPDDVPDLVDEVPLLVVAACAAEGTSRFAGLAELRHKESDRLAELAVLAAELGAEVALDDDSLAVTGRGELHPPRTLEHPDHRLAMARAVARYAAAGGPIVAPASAAISYPRFADDLAALGAG